eukprot:SM000013S26497  [mRNA]  locus=s13:779856:781974:+ [translate_table: standard]
MSAIARPCNGGGGGGGGGGGAGLTYRDAGVDIDAGAELVRRIARMAPGIGGFGGLFPFGDSYLVAGTDGVGTKLKLAFEMRRHDTIGIDLRMPRRAAPDRRPYGDWTGTVAAQVAMSVNDVVTSGAAPLFFLDYYATGRLDVDVAEAVVRGIVNGCEQAGCVLLGGEASALLAGQTAEMPGFYAEGEYDLSGFAVGAVKRDSVIDGRSVAEGDRLIALPSSGVHSNGFSLVRKILERTGTALDVVLPGGNGSVTVGEALLAPTVIYVRQVLDLVAQGGVRAIAHITGGGFTDNIPRVLPSGLAAAVRMGSWHVPAIFRWLQEAGGVDEAEMFRTFNMGVGMVLVVGAGAANQALDTLLESGSAFEIGRIVQGDGVKYTS